MEIIIIPVFTAIVYTIIEILKNITGNPDNFKKFIPAIACALGIVCALVAFFFVPGVLPTANVVVAAVIGGASGLAATGVYENIKNLFLKESQDGNITDNNNY